MSKMDVTTRLNKKAFHVTEDHTNVNRFLKAMIINFGDERGDIIVTNDNFGTRRKYADFTEGKKKAGLHPMQIIFSGLDFSRVLHDRYIGADDKVHQF